MDEKKIQKLRTGVCPHCGHDVAIKVLTEVQLLVPLEDEAPPVDWLTTISEAERAVLSHARRAGILDSFGAVVGRVMAARGSEVPTNMEKFFLSVTRTAVPITVPQIILDKLIRVYSGARIQIWAAQGISLILAEGMLRGFIGQDILQGTKVKSAGGERGKLRLRADPVEVEEWIRTRYGYVSGTGAMFESMRVRSPGEFGRG